jgi:uncharacterized repeat protein (TIGR03803 family)
MMRIVILIYCGIVLASCSRVTTTSLLPIELPSSTSTLPTFGNGYKSLFSFNATDGESPQAGLIDVGGMLYGTTWSGGTGSAGTVFKVTTSGKEGVLYNFNYTGGSNPAAPLLTLNGTLYGTTYGTSSSGQCSGYGCGTVFEVNASGKARVLYRFKGKTDGYSPAAGLVAFNGGLFGTTFGGGSPNGCSGYGCGTVFEVSTSGKERVVYRFKGGKDGEWPYSDLMAVKGLLYGTTFGGGTGCDGYGCGTIFEVNTSGTERILYDFKDSPDGANPLTGVIALNGTFYGTTSQGGILGCNPTCGTVFEVSTSGKERVLYRFKHEPDGDTPQAGLIPVNGALYGTTSAGGSRCDGSSLGCGTVFKVTTSGTESVLFVSKAAKTAYGRARG